ncbi:MAG: iron ABC transporter permease [Hyphomonadaceae bacterium]|nr:iron ABC transporter permease [Hyphomonadaceae bacterium]
MTAALHVPRRIGQDRWPTRAGLLLWGAAAGLGVATVLSLSIGATGITLAALPRVLLAILTGRHEAEVAREQLVLIDIRLPRMLLGMFVGAALAVAGAMMQGMFRNPLADPGLIGVSSGAAVAAVATIALGNGLAAPWIKTFGAYALPVAAFLGGIATSAALVAIVTRQGQLSISTLLLAGVALAALNGALMGLIAFASNDRELRDLTLWMLGSLSGASWPKVLAVLPFAALVAAALPRLTRGLNGLLLGEAEAYHLGIDVEQSKRMIVVVTSAAVGAAVAVSGILGFVGIIVPHLVRLLAGPDHRIVLPASALMGATLVLIADIFARMLLSPAELPLGVVMAILGAPLFLHMVVKRGMAGG